MWVREQGVGRNKSDFITQVMDQLYHGGGDYHTTYWPQPSYLSSRKYYIESTFAGYHELDFTVDDRNTFYWHYTVPELGVEGSQCYSCHMTIIIKSSLMQIVETINPGQPALPDWVYNGAILGVQGGTEKMLSRCPLNHVLYFYCTKLSHKPLSYDAGYLGQARDHDVQVSAMWIQDWSGKIVTGFGTRVFWNWRWNDTWYPNLDNVIQELDADGVKMTVYLTPHLNIDGDVYLSAADQDNWLTDETGTLFQDFGEFTVATADIIKPPPDCNCINTGRDWYKQMIKDNVLSLGISGWMADFGEYTPINARTKFGGRWWGEDESEILHQIISQEWAQLNREVVEEEGKLGDILYWMRSGGVNSKFAQVMSWAGDQLVDWSQSDGLPSSIVSALSLASSGEKLTVQTF